ncbi:hypothetical protein QUF54_07765, partial [Candidatus Marithioploca araucensis]|nr:hypothetical protein [Candidatus Marithioploca araucensis]
LNRFVGWASIFLPTFLSFRRWATKTPCPPYILTSEGMRTLTFQRREKLCTPTSSQYHLDKVLGQSVINQSFKIKVS